MKSPAFANIISDGRSSFWLKESDDKGTLTPPDIPISLLIPGKMNFAFLSFCKSLILVMPILLKVFPSSGNFSAKAIISLGKGASANVPMLLSSSNRQFPLNTGSDSEATSSGGDSCGGSVLGFGLRKDGSIDSTALAALSRSEEHTSQL